MPRPKGKRSTNNQGVMHPDVNWQLRCAQATELRAGPRLPWADIAHMTGYASGGAVRNAVLREAKRRQDAGVDALRVTEGEMYDLLQQRIWPLAAPSDSTKKCDLWAVDRLLAISKARRDLWGMDMPPPDEIASQNVRRIYERRAG